MPKATSDGGPLEPIRDCYIEVPGASTVIAKVLPEISDSKSAAYNDETVIGRTTPIKTYSHSETRQIAWQHHWVADGGPGNTINDIITDVRALQSATYPRNSPAPFTPPVICRIKCGKLLADEAVCVVLRQYSVKFPTDTVWTDDSGDTTENFYAVKVDMDLTFDVVYSSDKLPGQRLILQLGV